MIRSPFIAADATDPDWRIALGHCLAHLERELKAVVGRDQPAEFSLGWCYLTDHFCAAAEDILAELQHRLPGVSWTGTVGIGIAASGVEYIDEPALALMIASLPRTAFRLYSGRQPLHADSFAAHTALVHADSTAPDLQELLQELAERTATGYLFGGLSSARTQPLQIADAVLTGGLSGVAFSADVDIVSRVTQGCQPLGPQRAVTRAEHNVVITLDGQPALACALHDLGLGNDMPPHAMADALSSTLVGLRRASEPEESIPGRFGANTLVRHIVGLDPRARVLAVGEDVEPGTRLAFCRRDPEAALADVTRIATEIQDELSAHNQRAAGAIYVSCVGRGGSHFGSPDAELRAIRAVLGDLALVGFFASGEIAYNHLYGYTGVLTVFAMTA